MSTNLGLDVGYNLLEGASEAPLLPSSALYLCPHVEMHLVHDAAQQNGYAKVLLT